ncbi:MAG: type II toxin-antitoxin system VapC family toxin [Myxococcales bacterium]|nr:type II toxin-antitoxin system VapC family toxin [Myxococcales bacterium]MDP3499641.1 type II toxin-antitoxin system VapC family toxin [Myxococcales bacterium]
MSARLLLDTNVVIGILNRDERLAAPLSRVAPSTLRIGAITLAELRYGIAKSQQPLVATANLRAFLDRVAVVPFDEAACTEYGQLRAALEKRGTIIGPLDLLIAAQALSQRWTLVTSNTREFRRVPGLKVVDWRTS